MAVALKLIAEPIGGSQIHVRVFMGSDVDHRTACGVLTLWPAEYKALAAVLADGRPFMEVEIVAEGTAEAWDAAGGGA